MNDRLPTVGAEAVGEGAPALLDRAELAVAPRPSAEDAPPVEGAAGPAAAASRLLAAPAGVAVARPRRARRRARWRRRLSGVLALLAPALWIVGADLVRRSAHLFALDRTHRVGYVGSAAVTAVFWALLLYAASRRRGVLTHVAGALFVGLFGLLLGVQNAFRSLWGAYLSLDVVLPAESVPRALLGDLPLGRAKVLAQLVLAVVVATGLLHAARRLVRRRRRITRPLAAVAWVAVACGTLKIPASYQTLQSTTPDLIYVHALAGLARVKLGITRSDRTVMLQRRSPAALARVSAAPARPRNVLLLVQESLRADVVCADYDPACELANRDSNAAAPGRFGFTQLRAVASSTAVSATTLWSGLRPTASREATHTAPFVWDYARAAGYDTAYISGQSPLYNDFRFLIQDSAIEHFVGPLQIDSAADFWTGPRDSAVTDAAIAEWGRLKEPFLAVVHYSNIHAPRVYDRRYAPFQPVDRGNPSPSNEKYKNYYKDVVYLSDLAVGKLLRAVRATKSGQRTVVVYTSDHGESYHEHNPGDHAGTVFDEEIRVPGWIDAPAGVVSEAEAVAMRGKRDALLWHVDVLPTLLDLLGVWDEPAFAGFRSAMMGHPLTRPELTTAPVPLSNVSWAWEYRYPNWGVMQGSQKIVARHTDSAFHCFDVVADPGEIKDLGPARCRTLFDAGRALFPVAPARFGRLRDQPSWGDPR